MTITERDAAAVIAYLQDQRALGNVQDTMPQSWAYQINETAPEVDPGALQRAAVRCVAHRREQAYRRDIEISELIYAARAEIDRRAGMTRSQIVQHVPRELGGSPELEVEWVNRVSRLLNTGTPLDEARKRVNGELGIAEAERRLVPPPPNLSAALKAKPAPADLAEQLERLKSPASRPVSALEPHNPTYPLPDQFLGPQNGT